MQIQIEVNTANPMDAVAVKVAIEKLAKNVNKENLLFLAELSEKPNINAKLESKKSMIKTFI